MHDVATYESGAIVVTNRLGVTEGFQDGIGKQYLLLYSASTSGNFSQILKDELGSLRFSCTALAADDHRLVLLGIVPEDRVRQHPFQETNDGNVQGLVTVVRDSEYVWWQSSVIFMVISVHDASSVDWQHPVRIDRDQDISDVSLLPVLAIRISTPQDPCGAMYINVVQFATLTQIVVDERIVDGLELHEIIRELFQFHQINLQQRIDIWHFGFELLKHNHHVILIQPMLFQHPTHLPCHSLHVDRAVVVLTDRLAHHVTFNIVRDPFPVSLNKRREPTVSRTLNHE